MSASNKLACPMAISFCRSAFVRALAASAGKIDGAMSV
jgi:hypothetical protein